MKKPELKALLDVRVNGVGEPRPRAKCARAEEYADSPEEAK